MRLVLPFAALLLALAASAHANPPTNIAPPTCDVGTPFLATDQFGVVHAGCRGEAKNPKPMSLIDKKDADLETCRGQVKSAEDLILSTQDQLTKAAAKSDADKAAADVAAARHETDNQYVNAAHNQHMDDLQAIADLNATVTKLNAQHDADTKALGGLPKQSADPTSTTPPPPTHP